MAFDDKGPVLISSIIEDLLGIDVSVLCGANIAKDVAWDHFSETTIGTAPLSPIIAVLSLYSPKAFAHSPLP